MIVPAENATDAAAHMKWVRRAGLVLAAVVFAWAAYALFNALRPVHAADIQQAMDRISAGKLWFCVFLTGLSFAALGGYDVIAVGVVSPGLISGRRAWFAGVLANAIANTVGFHALTATAVRYRILSRSGLTLPDIARVISLSWTALAFGFSSFFALAMLFSGDASTQRRLAGLCLLGFLAFLVWWLKAGRTADFWGLRLSFPSSRVAAAQIALGSVEMAAAVGGLYVLMPGNAVGPFPVFAALYIAAVLLGIASHVPGGLGVFEATMLSLSHGPDKAGIVAALLLYRLVYNLLPFALSAGAFGVEEIFAAINSNRDSA